MQRKTLIDTDDLSSEVQQVQAHQRCIARVVYVHWTGSRRVHVAEQTLDLPQRDSPSSVRHLKIKERYVKIHKGPLVVLPAGSRPVDSSALHCGTTTLVNIMLTLDHP